jgi:hypothetical protein
MHGCGEVALVNRSVIKLAKEGLQFGSGRHGPPGARGPKQPPMGSPARGSGSPGIAAPRGCRSPRARSCAWGGCTRGVDNYLLVKLASNGVLRVNEPLLEATIKMAGIAPGRQSGQLNAGAAVRYQVARIGGPLSGLPRTWLGGRGGASLRCLCGWGAIAGWGAMDG